MSRKRYLEITGNKNATNQSVVEADVKLTKPQKEILMQLKELLFGVSIESVFGTTSVSIDYVTADSRQVEPNALFVAISR